MIPIRGFRAEGRPEQGSVSAIAGSFKWLMAVLLWSCEG
jgi:hypothetical protein